MNRVRLAKPFSKTTTCKTLEKKSRANHKRPILWVSSKPGGDQGREHCAFKKRFPFVCGKGTTLGTQAWWIDNYKINSCELIDFKF